MIKDELCGRKITDKQIDRHTSTSTYTNRNILSIKKLSIIPPWQKHIFQTPVVLMKSRGFHQISATEAATTIQSSTAHCDMLSGAYVSIK